MHYIVNLTTQEYIICDDLEHRNKKLIKLLKKNTEYTALIENDIGESRWRREDKIVISPENTDDYVRKNYSLIEI
jgi:hypothetical protein